MSQLNLFSTEPVNHPYRTDVNCGIKTNTWYSIEGYEEPGKVIEVYETWVRMDGKVSPCHYARMKDLTLKQ
tara:strand:+ start:2657 stop:2869 length:213 start_codon:yes stop_codon:yes gene_type:complete